MAVLLRDIIANGLCVVKLISHIYGILKAILPRDTATMVINKIQEELSK